MNGLYGVQTWSLGSFVGMSQGINLAHKNQETWKNWRKVTSVVNDVPEKML
jgi:hypothetical protein